MDLGFNCVDGLTYAGCMTSMSNLTSPLFFIATADLPSPHEVFSPKHVDSKKVQIVHCKCTRG